LGFGISPLIVLLSSLISIGILQPEDAWKAKVTPGPNDPALPSYPLGSWRLGFGVVEHWILYRLTAQGSSVSIIMRYHVPGNTLRGDSMPSLYQRILSERTLPAHPTLE
jgi:hypothetical protein